MPVNTGMGFVLVQHLAPGHESILPQLLAKTTAIPVLEAKNKMRVEPDHVYVIPENASMSIADGILQLGPREKSHGRLRSVDFFLQSLAKDRGSLAIAVILSGTDFDGSAGVEAIKGEGGITFAQDEKSAKFDGMPRHAADTGYVDIILPPQKIAQELGHIAISLGSRSESETKPASSADDGSFKKILQQLRLRKKVDFTFYKPATIKRRIRRRLVLNKINRLNAYVTFLQKHPDEIEALYQDMLINVTSFFRDPEMFEALKEKIFPQIIANRTPDQAVRIWVAGCSTGQETYAVAMAFLEFAAQAGTQIPLQIFATDLNESMLEKARAGRYSRGQIQELSPERLRRFFIEQEGAFQICKPIREMCIFAQHDLANDPPFSRMDLVTCRNMMIYFEPPLQKKVIPVLHYSLKPDGFLVLGTSETVGEFTNLFSVANKAHRIYSKKSTGVYPRLSLRATPGRIRPIAALPRGATPPMPLSVEAEAQREADRVALAKYAPVGVVVNSDFDVIQFRGATGQYLEAMPGKASFNILKMAREGLLMPLRAALHKAKKANVSVRKDGLLVRYNGHSEKVNLEVIPLRNTRENSFLILFEPISRNSAEQRRLDTEAEARRRAGTKEEAAGEIIRLQSEVTALKECLQSATEQYEATNEKIQSSNEEAQSANEELQSINEELETTKEELESTNEELHTVNDEMGNRNVE
ncbi:MAG: CheR family methyltransferase, partial [Verrucomicrobiota bacterium]